MENLRNDYSSTPRDIKSGMHTLAKNAEQLVEDGSRVASNTLHTANDKVSDLGRTIKESSTAVLDDVQRVAEDAYNRTLEEGKRQSARLEEDIRKSPFVSIGLAFLGGAVIASLLKR